MVIALITLLFLGGGSLSGFLADVDALRDQIKQELPRGPERSAALDVLDRMEDAQEERSESLEGTAGLLHDEIADHEATVYDVDALWEAYHRSRSAYNHRLVALRFELKAQLTREQWQAVFAAE